ncbi:hypothetical protein FRB99_004063 [Tulasnella sp. 403]|nr:hypothetical protein FRB99_004063 [Tulasnella sp. 403]
MCSYNQISNTYSCENNRTLTGLLKGELGFQGCVTADWWAKQPTCGTLAANKGLGKMIPGGTVYGGNTFGSTLLNPVNSGQVSQAHLAIAACHLISPKRAAMTAPWPSGGVPGPYLVDPLSAVRAQALSVTVTSILSDGDTNGARNAARGKAVALVFISANSGEGYVTVRSNARDPNDLNAWHNGKLVQAVAPVNRNTIIAMNSIGLSDRSVYNNYLLSADYHGALDQQRQRSLGQEAGNAIVDIPWGNVNPSGRLPYTIAESPSDYPAQVTTGEGTINHSEELFIDYAIKCLSR